MKIPKVTIERLNIAISKDDPTPKEFRLFGAGKTSTTKGDVILDDAAVADSIAAFADHGNDLVVDYEHKSLNAFGPAGSGKAAGWFKLEARNGELWATDVEWTKRAAQELTDREWRFFSPAVALDEKRRVQKVVNIGLTNIPATKHMTPLMASEFAEPLLLSTEDPTMKLFATLVGLSESAPEAEIYAALARLKDGNAELLSLVGASSIEQAKGKIEGWKKNSELLPVVQEQLAQVNEASKKAELVALAEKGVADKKLTPALKEWALKQTIEVLSGFLETAPVHELLAAKPETEPKAASGNSAKVAAIVDGKKFTELSNMQKHELFLADEDAYRALKAASEA